MDDNLCHQFVVGFCLRQEFQSENTVECKKLHDSGRKNAYEKDTVYETDQAVFEEFDKVLNEISYKIEVNMDLLKYCTEYVVKKSDLQKQTTTTVNSENDQIKFELSDIRDLLEKLHYTFLNVLDKDEDPCRSILIHQFYWSCISVYEKKKQNISLQVCKICSFVYENECEHPFHNKYLKLITITKHLKKKLNKSKKI
ncbi:hypothetical protein M153_3430001967 [Pseudoloma neurophilia]|uniref:Uncharacterized protein n=1 Tax=Pseudoloma neurophilia TaxID=146866 RepID=A0A0R0LXZ6_9MICR|nr:hypothetical protein M153_3430001967 [Pseudoloma neurophilia]